MSLKNNFGGMYRKGGVLYYTNMRTRAWDSKMCNVCNVCNASSLRASLFWHKYQNDTALFVNARTARHFDKKANVE